MVEVIINSLFLFFIFYLIRLQDVEYGNPRTFEGIMSFMRSPEKIMEEPKKVEKKEEAGQVWDSPGSEFVVHLGDNDFADYLTVKYFNSISLIPFKYLSF